MNTLQPVLIDSWNISTEGNRKFGSIIAYLTSLLTIITLALALTALPNSGSNCIENCVNFAYTEITSEFPGDYFWMVVAIFMILSYLFLMTILHRFTPQSKKIYSNIAMNLALVVSVIILMNYYMQLRIIQASLVLGETAGIPLLTQYNPNGVFISLEELGFLLMSFSFFFSGLTFSGGSKLERGLRIITIAAFVISLIAYIAMFALYGTDIEDRYEIIVISVNWLLLIAFGIMTGKFISKLDID